MSRGGRYRDVALNLQIHNQLTTSLCVNYHVCELQLIPFAFAKLKVPASALFRCSQVFSAGGSESFWCGFRVMALQWLGLGRSVCCVLWLGSA